jgi:hypothetical protein
MVEMRNIDKSLMMVFLLEECNFSYINCLGEDKDICLDKNEKDFKDPEEELGG